MHNLYLFILQNEYSTRNKEKHPWLNLLLPSFESLEARIVALS